MSNLCCSSCFYSQPAVSFARWHLMLPGQSVRLVSVVSNVLMIWIVTFLRFVMKVEPHSNGPLFTEMHCLLRIGLQRHRDGQEVDVFLKLIPNLVDYSPVLRALPDSHWPSGPRSLASFACFWLGHFWGNKTEVPGDWQTWKVNPKERNLVG